MFTRLHQWLGANRRRSCGHSSAASKNSFPPRLETMEERLVPAFLAATDYGARVGDAVLVADFNGDGKLDIASVGKTRTNPSITVQLGDGRGGFGSSKNTNIATTP